MNPLIEQKVKDILQEEICDRVIYQDRHAEEVLRRGLQSAESRLQVYALSLYNQGRLDALGQLESVLSGYEGNRAIIRAGILSHIASLKEQIK